MTFPPVVTQNLNTLSKQCAKVVRQNRKSLGFLGCLNCKHLLTCVKTAAVFSPAMKPIYLFVYPFLLLLAGMISSSLTLKG